MADRRYEPKGYDKVSPLATLLRALDALFGRRRKARRTSDGRAGKGA